MDWSQFATFVGQALVVAVVVLVVAGLVVGTRAALRDGGAPRSRRLVRGEGDVVLVPGRAYLSESGEWWVYRGAHRGWVRALSRVDGSLVELPLDELLSLDLSALDA